MMSDLISKCCEVPILLNGQTNGNHLDLVMTRGEGIPAQATSDTPRLNSLQHVRTIDFSLAPALSAFPRARDRISLPSFFIVRFSCEVSPSPSHRLSTLGKSQVPFWSFQKGRKLKKLGRVSPV